MKQHSTSANGHGDEREEVSDDAFGLERLVFFSDAVFAIAITLLALEIRLPEESKTLSNSELLSQLFALGPQYLGYFISFVVIGSFWVAHHAKFRVIKRFDGRLIWLNLLLLMVIAFIPFPTSVLSINGNRIATIFYALTMVSAGFLSTITWWYAAHNNRLTENLSHAERQQGFLRNLVVPAVFLVSIGIAFINDDAAKYSMDIARATVCDNTVITNPLDNKKTYARMETFPVSFS